MSYTFTSPNKNYHNNETISHSQLDRDRLDRIFTESKSILMVGWRYDSDFSFVNYMVDECNKDLTIVEIYEPNTKTIRSDVKVFCCDIIDFPINKNYDLLLWQHGPEHVFKQDVLQFLKRIECNFKHIILETPYGNWPQGEMYGNVYETHISEWSESDYEAIGYNFVKYAGQSNTSFIIGYK